jgi:hypothetical protein
MSTRRRTGCREQPHGAALRSAAQGHLTQEVTKAATAGSAGLLSARHESPTEWARFTATDLSGNVTEAPLTITLRDEHHPYWSRAIAHLALHKVQLFAEPRAGTKNTIRVALAPNSDTGHDLSADTGAYPATGYATGHGSSP